MTKKKYGIRTVNGNEPDPETGNINISGGGSQDLQSVLGTGHNATNAFMTIGDENALYSLITNTNVSALDVNFDRRSDLLTYGLAVTNNSENNYTNYYKDAVTHSTQDNLKSNKLVWKKLTDGNSEYKFPEKPSGSYTLATKDEIPNPPTLQDVVNNNNNLSTQINFIAPGVTFPSFINSHLLEFNDSDGNQVLLNSKVLQFGSSTINTKLNGSGNGDFYFPDIGASTSATLAITNDLKDATNSIKGLVRLNGDLGGTADAPTVPALSGKQATLVSGTNIKTINGTSLLGSGNITLPTGGAVISGSANYLPKFNSNGDNIVNSNAVSNNNELLIQGDNGKSGLRFTNIRSEDKFVKTKLDLSKYFVSISAKCGLDINENSYYQDNTTTQIIKVTPDKKITIIRFPAQVYINTWCKDYLGNIYFIGNNRILYKIDSKGVLTEPIYDKTALTLVNKIGIDRANNIFLGKYGTAEIYKLDSSLAVSLFITLPTSNFNVVNTNFLFDAASNMYTDIGLGGASFYKISPEGVILYTAYGPGTNSYGFNFIWLVDDVVYLFGESYTGSNNWDVSKISSTGIPTLIGTLVQSTYGRMNSVELYEGNIYYTKFDEATFNKFDPVGLTLTTLDTYDSAGGVFNMTPKGVFNILSGTGIFNTITKVNRGNRTTSTGEIVMDDFYKSDRLVLDTPLQINSSVNINSLKNSSNYTYNKSAEWDLGAVVDIVEDTAGNIYHLVGSSIYKTNYKEESTLFATVGSTPIAMVIGNDIIYTANSGDNTVSKVTMAGAVTTFATGIASPKNMLFDSLGNLIIHTQVSASALIKITPAGIKTAIATLPFGHKNYLTIDAADNLYTTQLSTNYIYKTTMAGTVARLGTTSGTIIQGPLDSNVRLVTNTGFNYTMDNTTGVTTDLGYYLPYSIVNTTPIIYQGGSYYYAAGNSLRKLDPVTKLATTLVIAPTTISKYKIASNGILWVASGTKLQKYTRPYSKLLTTTETGNIIQIDEEISQTWIKNNKIFENIPVYENNSLAKNVLPNNHLYRTSTGVLMITF